jgi:hypothetical protein
MTPAASSLLCRFVRGFLVGADAASPDFRGFCGDAKTQAMAGVPVPRARPGCPIPPASQVEPNAVRTQISQFRGLILTPPCGG